jgi:hypothetical protein
MCKQNNEALTQKYLRLLKAVAEIEDEERGHKEADGVLMDLLKEIGFDEVVQAYLNIPKWFV